MNLKTLKNNLFAVAILIIAFRLLTFCINKPFWGHHDWNSVVYSTIARNYVRYGYFATKFGQVTNQDFQPKNEFGYITHYPPLLPIIISVSFRLFGTTEAAARLPIILFSISLVFFIYLIGKEIHSKLLGLFASATVVFLPIFLYFGKLPVHDTIVPSVSVLGFWAYIKFIKEKKVMYYYLLIGSLIFGGLINWSAFYLAAALAYHQLITKNKTKVRNRILALIPLSVIVFTLHLIHIRLLGLQSQSAFSNFLKRVNPYLTADLYGFTLLKYIRQEILYFKIYYTLPVFLGSAFFICWGFYRLKKKKLDYFGGFVSALFIYGIIQLLVFEQLSFIHDYMIYYLLPFMVLSFAYAIFIIFDKFKNKVIFPLILASLLFLILFNQFKYTQTLLATSVNKRGYKIAQIIKNNTLSGQKAFVTSNSYKEFQDVFIGYYSDREVDYGEQLPGGFDKSFKLIIRPKDHDPLDINSKKLLNDKFPRLEDDDFIWYKIN